MNECAKTPFHDRHLALGANMVSFGGWEMPLHYPSGIVQEHLATRKYSGLFDVSHMGRFMIRGGRAVDFLQHVLSNNAAAIDNRNVGSQYTIIPTDTGGAMDDAYLYRFTKDEYLLVVNAANRQKDWDHLQTHVMHFDDVALSDQTEDIIMLALQGPMSRKILEKVIQSGRLPEPMRNAVSTVTVSGAKVHLARTGYTGEPICFELFTDLENGLMLWDQLLTHGASPVGLGARDTLRLEAGLPLYGNELGRDPEGAEIPVMASPLSKFAVSFSPLKGEFIGRDALVKQFEALSGIMMGDEVAATVLPRLIRPVAITGRGVARHGFRVFKGERFAGYITSGTMVPYWTVEGEGLGTVQTDQHQLRSIGLAYMDSDIKEGDKAAVQIRNKEVDVLVVPFHLRSDAPPYAHPIVYDRKIKKKKERDEPAKVGLLLTETLENTVWRQRECINLIPSEMTPSPMSRLLSAMDPAFRYAEHRTYEAFDDADIYYYQGTGFISEVERRLEEEMIRYLGCEEVETRIISGQMANMAVFSALMDYVNRHDRKREPRRLARVMNHHIGKGGHLSAQPMGALKDFVARDPRTERPAVVNFPVLDDNPFQIDVPAALELIDEYRPELIIFGRSMVLHKEPVAQIRRFLDEQGIHALVMYDMAHVLGLIGPHFQQPFNEGADLVTGSTHKTFFGTQRGVVGTRFQDTDDHYELWKTLRRRVFPGSVSNHHPGTLLGLLMAAYEMNRFKDAYQSGVIGNAKAFARALNDCGLRVAGDPAIDFTETHQVILIVGYGQGPDIARRLEANNIICNYQAIPGEEGFTASGALRLGVSEMTRFGMGKEDFREVAQYIRDVIADNAHVADEVASFRKKFLELKFCFSEDEYTEVLQKLRELL